jgi:transcriptional regulator with XRE-family HTH domain
MSHGPRIRALRRRQGRTLQTLAKASRCSKSMLSKIETGNAAPTVALLSRIAAALGVPLSALVGSDPAPGGPLHLRPADLPESAADKGYRFRLLAAGRPKARMQPILFTAESGSVRPSPLRHEGDELVWVLEGQLRYRVGAVEVLLRAGEGLYFDAAEEHDMEPVGGSARWLAVFCGPQEKAR